MHLYIITRGIKHEQDRFINDLQAQYFPYEYEGKKLAVQLAVRPIQLFELVFPEPSLNDVLATIKTNELGRYGSKLQNYYTKALRIALNAKKIDNIDLKNAKPRIVYKENLQVEPIGLKKDYYHEGIGERL